MRLFPLPPARTEPNPPHDRGSAGRGEGGSHTGVRGSGPQDAVPLEGAPSAGGGARPRVTGATKYTNVYCVLAVVRVSSRQGRMNNPFHTAIIVKYSIQYIISSTKMEEGEGGCSRITTDA